MKIVFMGTPAFAVPSLQALIDSEEVVAVFTQPDKPKGRGYKLTPSPVKQLAVTHNIPIFQPQSLKKGEEAGEMLEILRNLSPDLIVVVAYGKILPTSILEAPKHFCINVHASLLPKLRGAAPIQWAVVNGEHESGVTTMQMADGIDMGDMLLKNSTLIGEEETASELHDRLSILGAELLLDTIKAVKADSVTPIKQDESLSTHAPILTKALSPINFQKSALEVRNLINGLADWPCATANMDGNRLKFYRARYAQEVKGFPGEVVNANDFTVACGDGNGVTILELQSEGGKRMKTADYLRGNKLKSDIILTQNKI